MRVYGHRSRFPRGKRCVAVGVFDGVHRGHLRILKKLLADARRQGARAAVVTFDPHPNKILRPGSPHPILMSLAHRLRFFERLGIDDVIVIRFSRSFASISREVFLEKFLVQRLGMCALSVGHDFRFGKMGKGDVGYLRARSHKLGYTLSAVPPLKADGKVVSSTRIRRLIDRGRLREAAAMLGRPVSVYGDVVRGHGRGKQLGFPTANLNPHHETMPPSGVYAAWGDLDGKKLKAVLHIGARPTFGENDRSVEAHFLFFQGNVYEKELELLFVARLRGIKRFKSQKELIHAIDRDIEKASRLLR